MPDEQPVTSAAREVVESVMELKLLEPWPVNSISIGSRPSMRAFWRRRSRTRTCTSAALALFEGEPPELDAFLAHIESRLHLVPRYRQKLATPPLETGRPLWIDDPTFNLAYHVRHTALPPPGEEDALLNLCARIFSQRLDRSKPLWELWLRARVFEERRVRARLEDPPRGRRRRVGRRPLDRAVRPHARGPAASEPRGAVGAAARADERRARRARAEGRGARGGGRRQAARSAPSRARATALDRAREVATGIGEVAWTALNHPPDTPFNVPPGPHRRIKIVRAGLDEFKLVKSAFGTTVNDVVLAVVTGALAFFLQSRGRRTEGVELKAAVPVSVRPRGRRPRSATSSPS